MNSTPITISPSFEEFERLSTQGNLVPMYAIISADTETPVSVFQKLCTKEDHSFILESAQRTGEIGRYSFIARKSHALFKAYGKLVSITENGKTNTFESASDPLRDLEAYISRFNYVDQEGLPKFKGGMVGYVGYDTARFIEPKSAKLLMDDQLGVPDIYFMLAKEVVCFDHLTRRIYIVSNVSIAAGNLREIYNEGCTNITKVLKVISNPVNLQHLSPAQKIPEIIWKSNTTRDEFCTMVSLAKELIFSGHIMQVVLSQRFETEYTGDPLNLYRMLWMINPSPYMFLINFGDDLTLVGSSPEVHVRSVQGKVEIRPIAGTRRRGKTQLEDEALAHELLNDPKELAEHVMLIDLARNDIGRIAKYGSVEVTERFGIERFSHVMHIVSNVVGKLNDGLGSFDVLRATFPAGTVSGAPKIRAMQIINQFEKSRRGVYAGAVGYFGFEGNHDSCIALRTVVLKNGKAYVQAGAGVVADSTPEGEFEECQNKARGMLIAIASANQISE